ncbi:type VII secretion protein EccCa [Actinorugispora endophytica]|uniref:S-DNA-T family DNA segregation ATPase FtsK/SpoIIIE n=1 Tax=Actinorugispora endophytica TaxID=1605990 RepID=A0A4R6UER6_9ACTN|nr:type VII secretion protein EccCa [Actinorugispora endophytica]TDQ44662.1 S-DNA-T family DNA segregation ATPase FtsK/SpoIIIE [Actinorugispora endophytica]
MNTILIRRPPRRPGPDMPSGELSLQEPPELPEAQSSISSVFMYLPMAMTSMAMLMLFIRPGAGGAGSIMPYLAGGMMLVGAVVMLAGQYLRAMIERSQKLSGDRRDYLRYLAQNRARLREVVTEQRDAMLWRAPPPEALWSIVRTSRLWERRSADDDFAEIRVAVGEQAMGMVMSPLSTKPVEDLEPLSAHALRRFINAYSTVGDQPVSVYLRGYAHVSLRGDAEACRAMVRAMIGQLAVFHTHDDLRIAVCVSDQRRFHWSWLKWLPHTQHPTERDGAGPVRMVSADAVELERLIGDDLADRPRFDPAATPSRDEPFTVIVVDGGQVPPGSRFTGGGYRNAVVIDVFDPLPPDHEPYTLALKVAPDKLEVIGEDHSGRDVMTPLGRPDALTRNRAESLARLIAPYRVSVASEVTTEPLTTDFELTTLLGIPNLYQHDVHGMWEELRPENRLRVPIGVAADGSPLELDLKESALGGMGPHGMLIGATGSGKSELLRTLVLSLALTHSSETLNFVLVDFKGGATFIGLDSLQHTSALITNLAGEATLVERMQDALHGELIRRQEHLRTAGNFVNIHEYQKAYHAAPGTLEPMPTLFVVVDEFSELLAAHRDFMDLFVMIGRLGRSLGVHLLLASQRLDEGRMHQLESHLSYRIGLRTFSAIESRGVLGVPDAHQLPPAPGNGYLKSDTETLTRFKAAYVSGAHQVKRRVGRQLAGVGEVVPFIDGYVAGRAPDPEVEEETPEDEEAATLLAVALDRLKDQGIAAREVWLAPLGTPPLLDELLMMTGTPLPPDGLAWSEKGRLKVALGIIDRPFDQLRLPLKADLAGAGGHVGIAGGPQSGKSTLLASLITTLALTNTPAQVQFYCIDCGGGVLQALGRLPHVGSVVGRMDGRKITRTVMEMTEILDQREAFFAENAIDSMNTYRRRRAEGEFADQSYGDVFLVIDGWGTIRQDFMDLVAPIIQLVQRGLNYGVHVVVASPRWADFHSGLRDLMGTRFELRMGDPVDSMVNMRKAQTVPRVPGRGITEDKYHFLTALPRADGNPDSVTVSAGMTEIIDRVTAAWGDKPGAPPVRTLPSKLYASELPPAKRTKNGGLKVALGLESRRMKPFWHDFSGTPHLIVVGDTETGKTTLLRHITNAIREHYDPATARVVLVDQRRELYDAVPKEMQLGYAVSGESTREMMIAAAQAMKERLPGPDITPERIRKRDWWTGPELFIVIDDLEMVAGSGPSPLTPLLPLLSQGAEIGMHLILVHAAGGFGRASGDPVIRSLIDSNTPSIMLSTPPSEGMLFGNIRAQKLPTGRAIWISRRDPIEVQLVIAEGTEA